MDDLDKINTVTVSFNPNDLLRVILYRDKNFNKKNNCKTLAATIRFIKDTQCFKKSLF